MRATIETKGADGKREMHEITEAEAPAKMLEIVRASAEALSIMNTKRIELEKKLYELETKAARPPMPGGGSESAPARRASGEGLAASSSEVESLARFARTGEVERKAMSDGSAPDGGVTLSPQMDAAITSLAARFSPLRGLARVVAARNADWTAVVATGEAGAEWLAETDTRNATATPTLAKIVPPSGELSAIPSLTRWILQDSDYNLAQFIADYVGRAFGIAEGAAFWNGTGTNQPKGLTAYTLAATGDATRDFGTIEKLHAGSTTAINPDKLIELFHKLAPAYRGNASWFVAAETLSYIRQMKAVDSGQYLFSPSLAEGQPDRLLGRPVYEDANVPAMGSGNAPVWVGDFQRAYCIVDIGQSWVVRDEVTSKGNVLLWTAKRLGGALIDSHAVKTLVMSQ